MLPAFLSMAASSSASSIQACCRLSLLDLGIDWRELFLELICQRVGGFLLCFSNQGCSFYEGSGAGFTEQPCVLKFRLWESQVQL